MSEIKNVDKVLEKINSLAVNPIEALNKACLLVETAAKENCPVDDGTLRNSIHYEIDEAECKGYVGTNVDYAPYVHQGTGIFAADGKGRKTGWSYEDDKGDWHYTRGQKPNPFLATALESNREEIVQLFKEGLKND